MTTTIYTKTYNFKPVKRGDTFKGITISIDRDISEWAIRMWIVNNNALTNPVKKISIGNGITILDAPNGSFKIDPFTADMPAAVYQYDIEFTDQDNVKRTWLEGTFTVLNDRTK